MLNFTQDIKNFLIFYYFIMHFWLHWSCHVHGGYQIAMCGLLILVVSPVAEHGL